jgi:hypothetical protein
VSEEREQQQQQQQQLLEVPLSSPTHGSIALA